MALQIWLPLTGNINNQGLKNIIVTNNNATIDNSGILGQCYNFGDGTETNKAKGININDNLTTIIGEERSICAWVRPKGNHLHYSGAIASSGNWNSTRWAFCLKQNNTGFTGFDSSYVSYYSTNIPINEWTHLCVTVKNGITTFYKDGIYLGEQTRGSGLLSSDANNTMIGRETYAGGYFSFNGDICDVRIYDHALSPKEVKEISQGLLIHYKLDNINHHNYVDFDLSESNYTQTNYANKTTSNIINGIYHVNGYQSSSSIDTSFSAKSNNYITLSPNTWYYLSFYCNSKSDNDLFFGTSGQAYTTLIDSSNNYHYPNQQVTIGKKYQGYVSLKIQTGSDTQYKINLGFDGPNIYGIGSFIEFSQIMISLEKPIYFNSNINQNIIYDSSGYQNHGTVSGDFLTGNNYYNENYARYNNYLVFDGSTNKIESNLPAYNTNYTFSVWVKFSKFPVFVLDCRNSNSIGYQPIYITQSLIQTGGSTIGYYNTSYNFNQYNWYHIAVVYTDNCAKVYINGILKNIITALHGYNYDENLPLKIGSKLNDTSLFGGYMSDFRIYVTALSDDDILELYQNVASIDEEANIYTYEFNEETVNNQQMIYNGLVKTDNFIEINNDLIYDFNGDVFLKILHHNNPSQNLFTQQNCWFNNSENLYSNLIILKNSELFNSYDGNGYGFTFLVKESLTLSSDPNIFCWCQAYNPALSSTDGPGYVVLYSTTSPSRSFELMNKGTYGCFHNGNSWCCCCGSYQAYSGGIPGFAGIITTGSLELYVKIPDYVLKGNIHNKICKFFPESILCNQLIEK